MSSIYQRWPSARIVVVSALDRPETVDAAMARGAVALLCDVARSCGEPLVPLQTIGLGVPGDRSTIVGAEYGTLSFLAEMVSRAVPSRTDG